MLPGFPEQDITTLQTLLATGESLNFLISLGSPMQTIDFSLLSEEEKDRINRFRDPEDAQAFARARLLLRSFLMQVCGLDRVVLEMGPHGKPFCAAPLSPAFSISHGARHCIVSFYNQGRIGVDLENPHRSVNTEKISQRYFSSAEQEWLKQSGPETFIKIWTRKEARLKADGEGFTVHAADYCTLTDREWSYQEVIATDSLYGMIATRGLKPAFRLFHSI